MKIRNIMMLIIIPIIVSIIFLLNITYGLFFQNFILSEEGRQIKLIEKNLASFVSDNQNKYVGRVKDWSHWDETYAYLENTYPEYPDINLPKETFINLDINFIIFIDKNDSVFDNKFYDLNHGEFTEMPKDFRRDLNGLIGFSKTGEDAFGILKIGEGFYFVAASEVTETMKSINNGRMIIGRRIDENIIDSLEKNLDCSLLSISYVKNSDINKNQSVRLNDYSTENDEINLSFIISNVSDKSSSVEITLKKSRDMYRTGMQNVVWFAIFDTLLFILIIAIVFALLNRYLSRPFIKLIHDVANIDLNNVYSNKLPEEGKHEFLYLRQSVNKMLTRINTEQDNVRQNEEKLLATLLSVGDGVITVDIQRRIQFMNPVAEQLTGYTNEDAIGEEIDTIFQIKNEKNIVKSILELSEGSEAFLSDQTRLITSDGSEIYIDATLTPIEDKNTSTIGFVIVFKDFTEKREKQEKIEYLIYHDQLTDVFNRRYFEKELVHIDTVENLPLSILYADVNGLKFINDAFGHQSGDEIIVEVARVLKESCHHGIITRMGGDEFVVILPGMDHESVEKLANSAQEKISQIRVNNINLSVSFGWDTKTTSDFPAIALLKNAEDAMYQKKLLYSGSKSNAVIQSILNTLLIKNPREKAHSQRVGYLCKLIGQAFDLNADQTMELETAGELHDIGKIIVDEAILNKSDKLTQFETAQIQKHPETGYRLLGSSSEFYKIARYVLDHHERWDGNGYPKGLKGKAINWEARVIAIADSYDAMTSERPYKNTMSESEAVEEIRINSGKQFDPDISRVFVEKVLGYKW